jgi:PAS domain S-box-containing protein
MGIMQLQANPESVPFFLAAAISIVLSRFALRRRARPVARAFALMMVGEAAWAFFEALELVVVDIETKKLCFVLRATGTVTLILSLLATVLLYTGRDQWVKPPRFTVICAPALLLLVFAWTNPWHHLYWTRLWNASINGHWIAMPVYGPGFKAHFIYCYLLVAVSTVLLAEAAYRSAGVYRAQAAVMLFGIILPWVINIIDMSRLFGFIYVDSAAMSFGITGLAFVPGLFRYRLFDLTPVAWAAVVDGINDPVVVIDPSGRIVELNPAADRLIGGQSANLIGVSAARAFMRWPTLREHLGEIASRDLFSFELDGPETAPASSFDGRISPLGDDHHPSGWVLVLRDVTLQKRAEEEHVRMLREQAARALAESINRAKDRFLATLSHELRTPLTPVLATVTAMLAELETADSLRSVLEMIRRNVVLEVRLIDDLLDLSRIRHESLVLEREIVDAHDLVRQVIEICRDDPHSSKLQLDIDLLAQCHHVDADPIRFQQALWNLIKNAIKFTPPGGQLTVRSRNDEPSSLAPATPDLMIEVSDTGIGIEPDVLPRIFDVLEQGGTCTTRRFGGLGLGLTISRSILEQHGGRITAHSPGAGLGATFTIEIPTAFAPDGSSAGDDSTAEPESSHDLALTRPITVLLVEDNHDTLKYVSKLLSLRGYHVQPAADMASALEVASQAEFDVIVSDIELPDGSGLELLWSLRCAGNSIPAIALSGFGAPADIEQTRSAGFAIHLTKPVDFRRLDEAIRKVAVSAGTSLAASR